MGTLAVITRIVRAEDLKKRLHAFEEKYRMPSERFVEAFRNGKLRETEDFHEWSSAYGAWLLATKPRR